jgi:hypothetical protein
MKRASRRITDNRLAWKLTPSVNGRFNAVLHIVRHFKKYGLNGRNKLNTRR